MNRPNALDETLKSFLDGERIPNEIIVVDQTNDVDLREKVKFVISKYSSELNILYIFQEVPSLTLARNTGCLYCSNEIIIFSDDDITVQKNTLTNIYQIMSDSTISMIAGLDLNMRKDRNSFLGYILRRKSWFKRKQGHVTKAVYGRFPKLDVCCRVKTEWAMGYFFVVRKSLLNKWDIKWDENLISYAYAEDLLFSYDYYLKSKADNFDCVIDDRVSVWHRFSQEYRVLSRKATIMTVINREYISYRFFGFSSRLATRWSNFGDFVFRALKNKMPGDVLAAQILCDKKRKQIKNGIILPEWYDL